MGNFFAELKPPYLQVRMVETSSAATISFFRRFLSVPNRRSTHPVRGLRPSAQVTWLLAALITTAMFWPSVLPAEPVAVRYAEGAVQSFLVLRTLDEKVLAHGLEQLAVR